MRVFGIRMSTRGFPPSEAELIIRIITIESDMKALSQLDRDTHHQEPWTKALEREMGSGHDDEQQDERREGFLYASNCTAGQLRQLSRP